MDQFQTGLTARTSTHRLNVLGITSVALFAFLTVIYFSYRIPLWNPESPTLSTLLLACELFGTFSLALHIFGTWTLLERRAPHPQPGMTADIFVTTWNESVEMLRNTLLAAKQVRFAKAVWLLDDGNRAEMRALADELGVRYLTRTDRSHAKAGNLNNALKHSDAPFVAIFDCDHAPSPDFLQRTLGYFENPKVSFVQTPQDFYNIDSFQHRKNSSNDEVWHEQTLFYRVIQPGKDNWDATFFCGSCAVARRTALEDIGGFATGTITEDLHTSLKLHKKGWSSVFHTEALAFGLSPANLDQYDTQRLRWGRGAMQVWLKEGLVFGNDMTWPQKLCYLASTITYFEGWQKAIIYFMPMVVLLTGWMPIVWKGETFIFLFLAWLLSGMLVNEIVSRGYAKTIWMEEYNFFRYYTFVKATLALVIPINWRFMVTPKDRVTEIKLPTRLLPQAIVAIGALIAMGLGTYFYFTRHHLPEGAFISNLVWLALSATMAIKALKFASGRLRQRRISHRFSVPLPVRLTLPATQASDERVFIADDVSSHGMKLLIEDGDRLPETVQGVLELPTGPASFKGTVVRARGNDEAGRLFAGIRFDWINEAEADALNSSLYGNTLQWDVNSWSETKGYRLARFLPFREKQDTASRGDWQFATLLSASHPPISCLMQPENGRSNAWRIISYTRPQASRGLALASSDRRLAVRHLHISGSQSFSIGGGQVHVSVLACEASDKSPKFHRDPRWSHTVGDNA